MTPWQDIVMMIAGFVFFPALVVSIKKKAKYPIGTSLPTAIALTAVAISLASLELHLATATTCLTAACWYYLAVRR